MDTAARLTTIAESDGLGEPDLAAVTLAGAGGPEPFDPGPGYEVPGGGSADVMEVPDGDPDVDPDADALRPEDTGDPAEPPPVDADWVRERGRAVRGDGSGCPPGRPIRCCWREALDELERMVGLEPVKRQVRALSAQLHMARLRASQGLPVQPPKRHFVFSGPSGTGKTTVARILGRVFYALGLLAATIWWRPNAPTWSGSSSVRQR